MQPSALIPAHLKLVNDALLIGGQHLLLKNFDGIYVLSVGKAAAAMAQVAENILGNIITDGLVVTKYHHSLPLEYCKTIEAGHPVPDENGQMAALSILEFSQQLTSSSLLLCFISGGASALIADVAEGITLHDLQALSTILLQCGAHIQEINTVRKHISFLKGGQLVKHAKGATIFSFIISNVRGDDMSVIASGLTVADVSTYADAWQALDKYALTEKVPDTIKTRLLAGVQKTIDETPKPGDPAFNNVHNTIIGNNGTALQVATKQATKLGFTVVEVDNILHGEARDAATRFVQTLLDYSGKRPACLLAGGETTVTIKGNGKGGRNQEFVLAALCELIKREVPLSLFPVILCGGTDGTDGPTEAAGAVIDINIFLNINKLATNVEKYLNANDSFHFFESFGALITTGATQTNVMDVAVALI